jgi:hypothetical protein
LVPVVLSLAGFAAGPKEEPGARGGGAPAQARADALDVPIPAVVRPKSMRARRAAVAASPVVEGIPVPLDLASRPTSHDDGRAAGAPDASEEPSADSAATRQAPERAGEIALPDTTPRRADEGTEDEVGAAGGGGYGTGSGPGIGSGIGDGPGSGEEEAGRGRRRRQLELAGRVVGEYRPLGFQTTDQPRRGRGSAPYISIHEATKLRTRDLFPRLPAALWTSHRRYIVVVDLCVSSEGRVSNAELMLGASPVLDPIVLAAVWTWQYQPRLVSGAARPFCHLITIQYDPA